MKAKQTLKLLRQDFGAFRAARAELSRFLRSGYRPVCGDALIDQIAFCFPVPERGCKQPVNFFRA